MSVLNPTFFSKKKSAILSSCVPITIFVGFALSIGLSVSYINSNYLLSNQYEDNNKVRIALDLTHKTVDPFDTSYDF
jgi:hypothetical protein